MASDTYHESLELISEDTKNMHRGLVSLIEELEAIDWYQQRADACSDEALKAVLTHNKNEEIEHASMTLEWIRRHNQHFDQQLRTYLFTDGPIAGAEERIRSAGSNRGEEPPAEAATTSLGIGSLKGRV
jgi:uncharacterized protein